MLHLHRGRRGEQGQQRRVQGEVAGEEADRGRLPIRRGIRDAVGAIAGLVHCEQVGPAVAQAVAVDEVVVQAEAEVQQLLGARDLAQQALVGTAEAEVGRGDEARAEVLAAVGRFGLVEQPGHRRAECRRSGTGRGASAPR